MTRDRIAAASLAAGALLALVGASLRFGAGMRLGMVLLPIALVLLAGGVLGRALAVPALHRALVALAALTAVFALALVLVAALRATRIGLPGADWSRLQPPMFVGLVLAAAAFALAGLALRQLPRLPAAVAVGGIMLVAGVFGHERVADIGFWLSVPG